MHSECFITGQEMLQQVDGKDADAVVESLQDTEPDGAAFIRPTLSTTRRPEAAQDYSSCARRLMSD